MGEVTPEIPPQMDMNALMAIITQLQAEIVQLKQDKLVLETRIYKMEESCVSSNSGTIKSSYNMMTDDGDMSSISDYPELSSKRRTIKKRTKKSSSSEKDAPASKKVASKQNPASNSGSIYKKRILIRPIASNHQNNSVATSQSTAAIPSTSTAPQIATASGMSQQNVIKSNIIKSNIINNKSNTNTINKIPPKQTVNKTNQIQSNQFQTKQPPTKPTPTTAPVKKTIKKTKLTPNIIAHNVDHKVLCSLLKVELNHSNFAFKQTSASKTHIISNDKETFNTIKRVLNEQKITFFHQTPIDEKCKIILLKKMPPTYDINDVVATLEETFPNVNFQKVSKFVPPARYTKSKPRKYKNTCIWQLQLSPDTDISAVMKTTLLSGIQQYIRFELLNSNEIPQCKNCQRYGHIARNCNMAHRCVRCGGGHEKGNCQLPAMAIDPSTNQQLEESIPTCCNCGKKGHPANFRCEAYKQIVIKAKENKAKIEEQRRAKSQAYNNYIQKGLSFADMTRPKTQSASNPASRLTKATPPPKHQVSSVDTSYYQEILGTINLVKSLRPTLDQIKDPTERKTFIILHLLNNDYGC